MAWQLSGRETGSLLIDPGERASIARRVPPEELGEVHELRASHNPMAQAEIYACAIFILFKVSHFSCVYAKARISSKME
jgi:hypothetical protein